jgi:hypothetical protein
MQRVDVGSSTMPNQPALLRDQTTEDYSHTEQLPPSPTSSTDTPVFVTTTPRSDSPPSTSMSGTSPLPMRM